MIQRKRGLVRRTFPARRSSSRRPSGTKPYYEAGVEQSTWICENCQEHIPHSSEQEQFTAQAHILPKKYFDSVKLHPENRLHLCVRCHNDWDSSWWKAQRMEVASLALERFTKFKNLLNNLEITLLPDFFYAIYILPEGAVESQKNEDGPGLQS